MRQRGRRSALSLATITDEPVEQTTAQPPETMPDDQKAIWLKVISACPPGWFPPETLELLEQYCVHVCRARVLGAGINDLQSKPVRTAEETKLMYDLIKQEQRQTSIIVALATKMRIAQQSTYDKRKRNRRNSSTAAKPWSDDDED